MIIMMIRMMMIIIINNIAIGRGVMFGSGSGTSFGSSGGAPSFGFGPPSGGAGSTGGTTSSKAAPSFGFGSGGSAPTGMGGVAAPDGGAAPSFGPGAGSSWPGTGGTQLSFGAQTQTNQSGFGSSSLAGTGGGTKHSFGSLPAAPAAGSPSALEAGIGVAPVLLGGRNLSFGASPPLGGAGSAAAPAAASPPGTGPKAVDAGGGQLQFGGFGQPQAGIGFGSGTSGNSSSSGPHFTTGGGGSMSKTDMEQHLGGESPLGGLVVGLMSKALGQGSPLSLGGGDSGDSSPALPLGLGGRQQSLFVGESDQSWMGLGKLTAGEAPAGMGLSRASASSLGSPLNSGSSAKPPLSNAPSGGPAKAAAASQSPCVGSVLGASAASTSTQASQLASWAASTSVGTLALGFGTLADGPTYTTTSSKPGRSGSTIGAPVHSAGSAPWATATPPVSLPSKSELASLSSPAKAQQPSGATATTASLSGEIVEMAKKYAGDLKVHADAVCKNDDALRREGDKLDALEDLLARVGQINDTVASHLDLVRSQQQDTKDRLSVLLEKVELRTGECESLQKGTKNRMMEEVTALSMLLQSCTFSDAMPATPVSSYSDVYNVCRLATISAEAK